MHIGKVAAPTADHAAVRILHANNPLSDIALTDNVTLQQPSPQKNFWRNMTVVRQPRPVARHQAGW